MTSLGKCGFNIARECACKDRCAVQPPKAQEAPIRFSVRDQLVVCAFIGVVAGIVTFAVAARAEPYLKLNDQIAQEVTHVYRR